MNEEVALYLNQQPEAIRAQLLKYREWILEVVPDCEERFAYGMPTYRKKRNLIHIAAFKNHLGIYPGPKAIEEHSEALSEFKTSKGTIQVPISQMDLMTKELLQQLVRWNLAQIKKK